MNNDTAAKKHFEPGVYIRIDDVITGVRKLARVTEAGDWYIDLDAEDSSALPIYETLKPEEAGNILGWGLHVVDNKPENHSAWKELCDRLINSGEGVLTYNRAAYWAFVHENYDYDQALAAGRAESEAIAVGRKTLDTIAKNAGGLA